MITPLRPELTDADPGTYCPYGATAYYEVLGAVEAQQGLIHGRLDGAHGTHCALGGYFAVEKRALPDTVIKEVAALNDSIPKATPEQRKRFVMRWLKWKLRTLGFPYRTAKPKGYKK